MRIVGQDKDGRLILDLEGEKFDISLPINGDSPVHIINGVFTNTGSIPHGVSQSLFYYPPLENINEYQKLEIIDPRNHNFNKPSEPIKEQRPVNRWQILDIRG